MELWWLVRLGTGYATKTNRAYVSLPQRTLLSILSLPPPELLKDLFIYAVGNPQMVATMSSKSHLELFTPNSTPTTPSQLSSFTLFSKLPYEIRIAIWKCSLQVQRIIKIHVHCHMQYVANRAYNSLPVPSMERGKDDPAYYPVVQGFQVLSKLLKVTRESREAALAFYRVRVPCWLTHNLSKQDLWVPGEMYYNPEYDFLHLLKDKVDIIEFICNLKTVYDPRHVGLRNLALCESLLDGRKRGLHTIDPTAISPGTLQTFRQIIRGLDEVWFVSIQRAGRLFMDYETDRPKIYKTFFERPVPIPAVPLKFDQVRPDPRAISNDLSHLHLSDPNYLYNSWKKVIERFDIEPPGIQYRFLITYSPYSPDIYNRADASNWLQKEDDIWTGKHKTYGPFPDLNLFRSFNSGTPAFKHENPEMAVRPVIGFWLFPVEAFSDGYDSMAPDNEIKEVDLRDYWPDLAILRLDS